MKKVIALIVLVAVLLCVCGCDSGTQQTQPQQSSYVSGALNVGFSMVDITPRESTPLQGYGSTLHRFSNDVEYALKGTVLAITGENGETALLVETDMCTVTSTWLEPARLKISQDTGVPQSQIYIGASHTHAAPDSGQTGVESIVTYVSELVNALGQAACEAMADRKPAELYYGVSETENLNFVRNYTNFLEDGTPAYWGDNFGYEYSADSTTQHRSQVDPMLYILKITRENERDIMVTNFRAHPHLDNNSSTYAVSADYVGAMREAVDHALDMDFMFLQGASGNVNTYSKISAENRTQECPEYAALMMEYIHEALTDMTQLSSGDVKVKQTILAGKVNHEMDSLAARAKEVSSVWNANRDLQETMAIADKYGFHSPFHANAVSSKSTLGETLDMELNVVAIGDQLAIATMPLELFDNLGKAIQENSVYDHVLIMGYTGEHLGYMPDNATFETGSYEADICKYVAGTGEQIVDVFLSMLEDVKNEG